MRYQEIKSNFLQIFNSQVKIPKLITVILGSDISNINPEDATNAPVVVSVYRAGSVKVRIRKKSKRRKKKSNLGQYNYKLFSYRIYSSIVRSCV